MRDMNVHSTECTPYFCNRFESDSNNKCTICHQKLDGFSKFKYPTPAGSLSAPREFVGFDVSRIVPSDRHGGALHGYAHRACMERLHAGTLTEFPVPAYSWACMKGKIELQSNKVHRYLLENMQINKPAEYDKNSMNFFKCIGDMGLMDSIATNHKPPSGTVYRTHDGVRQCMQFVHFDKFHGMQIDPDDVDPNKRVPIMSNYTTQVGIADEMKEYRKKAFEAIYSETNFVERVDELTGKTEKLNLVQNEAKYIEGFSKEHVFLQELHHGLLNTGHRWWNLPFTFRILIEGKDAGIMELKIVDNDRGKNKLHPGKSLFVYNVAAYIAGSKLCGYVFWFAKFLALYMNRFTDIKAYDRECIKQVYLTTSSLNKAMKRDAPGALFTEIVIDKLWWDRDYVWNVPYVNTYSGDANKFPTNIVASLPSDTYVPDSVLFDSNSILDTLLMPHTATEIDPSSIFSRNQSARTTRQTLDLPNPIDIHIYVFSPPKLVKDHVLQPKASRKKSAKTTRQTLHLPNPNDIHSFIFAPPEPVKNPVLQPRAVTRSSLDTLLIPDIPEVDPSSTVVRTMRQRLDRCDPSNVHNHTLSLPEPVEHDVLQPLRFTRKSLKK